MKKLSLFLVLGAATAGLALVNSKTPPAVSAQSAAGNGLFQEIPVGSNYTLYWRGANGEHIYTNEPSGTMKGYMGEFPPAK